MPPTPPQEYLTPADVAARLGLRYSVIRQALAAGVITAPIRAGRVSVFAEADLPAIRAKLDEAGLIAPRLLQPAG